MNKDSIKIVFVGDELLITRSYLLGSSGPLNNLTNGKVYEVIDHNLSNYYYILINDLGDMNSYPKFLFKRLDEVRSEKLNIILK